MRRRQVLSALAALAIALPLSAGLRVHPQTSFTTGGQKVFIDGVWCPSPCVPKVFFGDAESPAVEVLGWPDDRISAVTPPHPDEGRVAVRVVTGAETRTVENDFAYVHDRVPVLVPVSVDAFPGSRAWSSQLWVYNGNDVEVTLQPEFCFGLGGMFPCGRDRMTVAPKSSRRLPPLGSPPWSIGGYVYVPRHLEANVTFQLLVSPSSDGDAGVSVPVIRDLERRERLTILNVPTGGPSRALLRVYVAGDADLTVNVHDLESGALLASQPLELSLPTDGSGPPLSAYMLSASHIFEVPEVRAAKRVRVEVVRGFYPTLLWGMVSVTHDETKRVTLFTPQ